MSSRRWVFAVAGVAVIASVAVWAALRHTAARDVNDQAGSGEKITVRLYRNPAAVPALELQDLDGRRISSASWRGKVTIVNFWATWCPPCRAEIPDLIALQTKYGDQLQVIGVSVDEGSVDAVRQFAQAQHINYPVVMSTPELRKVFTGVNALPTSFVLDREERLVQRHVGMLNAGLTEAETRVLAGLRVNASVEEVDRAQPLKLENAAQGTTIPGVDLAKLTPNRRTAALMKLNAEPCTCGCELTVARCRVDDPRCGISLPIAQRIVQEIADQP